MNAVEISGLEKRFGRSRALTGIELEIPRGGAVLVAGPNGAGKSTLLRLIGGLARPTRGRLRVLGVDPFGPDGPRLREQTSYLGVRPGLYPELQVRENLAFCARLRGLDEQSVERALAQLQLERWAERPLSALSFGYQRRVGLARALLGEPELLLFDEPWTGLDDRASERLWSLFEGLRERGATLIVAAHGVPTDHDFFDRLVPLSGGELQPGAAS